MSNAIETLSKTRQVDWWWVPVVAKNRGIRERMKFWEKNRGDCRKP